MTPFEGKCQIYKRRPHIFALALTVSDVLDVVISDLQKVDHGHQVQFLQWHHSVVFVKNLQ